LRQKKYPPLTRRSLQGRTHPPESAGNALPATIPVLLTRRSLQDATAGRAAVAGHGCAQRMPDDPLDTDVDNPHGDYAIVDWMLAGSPDSRDQIFASLSPTPVSSPVDMPWQSNTADGSSAGEA